MKNKIIILLVIPFLMGADYVCHDHGIIIDKVQSVGRAYSQREDCIKVDRQTLESITKYHKIINGKVVEMTQAEKDILNAPTQVQIDKTKLIKDLKNKMKLKEYTDEEINLLLNTSG